MKIRKIVPNFHGGSPIFSIDIQPGDRRFATGGRAESGAGLVVIWEFKSFVESKNANSAAGMKLLCRLENHVGCVNCVRWSENGRYLASAGDDSLITIMQYAGRLANTGENGLSVGKDHQNVELWKCVHTLRGHAGDVLHVAWSPGDVYLASCSVDNEIIIWNGRRFGEKIASLSGHEGLVKGVAWDPIGKYLASQSDDRSLRIWLTTSWTQTKIFQKPFKDCPPTTQFLRLDWSPDGSLITSSHAMNNDGPVSVLIERAGWEADRDLVGHRKAITCTRWSPCLYESSEPGSNKPGPSCLCAVGSKDHSLSVWSTNSRRPITVALDAVTQSIMDLSWSHSGAYLAACSNDGTVLFLAFSQRDTGRVMSLSEKAEVLSQLYGKYELTPAINGYTNGHDSSVFGSGKSVIIDNPDLIKIHENLRRVEEKAVGKSTGDKCVPGGPRSSAATNENQRPNHTPVQPQRQVEERTKEGRRRIKPIFLGSNIVTESNEDGLGNTDTPGTSSDVNESIVSTTGPLPVRVEQPTNAIVDPSAGGDEPDPRLSENQKSDAQASIESTTVPAKPLNNSTTAIKGIQIKRKQGPEEQNAQAQQPPIKKLKSQKRSRRTVLSDDEDEVSTAAPQAVELGQTKEDHPKASSSNVPEITLPVPAKVNQLSVSVPTTTIRSKGQIKITCQNGIRLSSTGPTSSKLTATESGLVKWQTLIGDDVLALTASANIVAAASSNRLLSILKTNTGSRLMPPIMLDSDISILAVQDHYLMAVTRCGLVHVWRLDDSVGCLCKESLLPIVRGSNISLTNGFITNYGAPVLTTSDGKSYVYNTTIQSWLVLFDPEDPVTATSMASKRAFMASGCKLDGPMATCLRAGTGSSSSLRSAPFSDRTNPGLALVAFLEAQMNTALELRSSEEYRFWLMQYVQYLTREALASPLRQLCNDLMEHVFKGTTKTKAGDILGIPKEALLREILPIIATNSNLQRLYAELKEQLAMCDSNRSDDGDDSSMML